MQYSIETNILLTDSIFEKKEVFVLVESYFKGRMVFSDFERFFNHFKSVAKCNQTSWELKLVNGSYFGITTYVDYLRGAPKSAIVLVDGQRSTELEDICTLDPYGYKLLPL
jgi:hypothetical protein